MKRKNIIKFLLGIVFLAVLIKLITTLVIEPFVRKKIEAVFNEKNNNFIISIDKVRISLVTRQISLERLSIYPKQEKAGIMDLKGEITSLKFKRIHLAKAIFKKDIEINEVKISNISINGKIPFPKEVIPANLSPLDISLGKVVIYKIDLDIENTLSSQAFLVRSGYLKTQDLQVSKHDTLSAALIEQIDIEAEELLMVTSDSMYTLLASGILYSTTSQVMAANHLSVKPNYSEYDFTAHYKYQTDRIEAIFNNIFLFGFSAPAYLKHKSLVSSYIEIGEMDINVFRDNRHAFKHAVKAEFQDLVYNYPGEIRVDSMRLKKGNIIYKEHAEKANEPGSLSFNEIDAILLKITNDTIYKTKSGFLEMKAECMLMKKSRLTVELKTKLFNPDNTYSLHGMLMQMEVKNLNPMLEKTAMISATSGIVDNMKFYFTGNSTKTTGKMTLLYHALDLSVKNKRTADATAIKERIISLIVNRKVMDSNPLPGKEVRVGIIDFKRDPEKFIFNYWFKSILSGVKTSLTKNNKD